MEALPPQNQNLNEEGRENDIERSPVENAMSVVQPPQLALVEPAGAVVVPRPQIPGPATAPFRPFTFTSGGIRPNNGAPAEKTSKRRPEREPPIEDITKRPKVGLKELTRVKSRRKGVTVDMHEIRARAHAELSDLLGVNSRTNVHFTIEEVTRLNDFIGNAGNVRSDITRSGLSLLVLVRQAEELWKELRSKYNDLEQEARTERAERKLLEERVAALEDHNTSQAPMEVDQVPMSEFVALREQNAQLAAKVEELTKTLAEHVTATPEAQERVAALETEATTLRERNSALSAEVAALTRTISEGDTSQSAAPADSEELIKLRQEIISLRAKLKSQEDAAAKEESNLQKKNTKRRKKAKGGASSAKPASEASDPKPESSATPGTGREATGDGTGKEDKGGFTVVQRKPRKPKLRTKSEAVAIKASEEQYAGILRKLRSDPNLTEMGKDTKTVKRTRQNELLLILNRDAKHASSEYARLVQEAVGDGTAQVRSLGAETPLQCKNLDETVSSEDLLSAITTQCGTGQLRTSVKMRKYGQGTQSATFTLPAPLAAMVLKVGKIKVNWSICPVTTIERPAVCFKCLDYGHKSWNCKGPDRSKLCRRCGAEGHKANGCKAKPKCLICTGEGNSHATGSFGCPSFKRALDKLKPCK